MFKAHLEHVQPLACRSVILNGYLLFVGVFGPIAEELIDELGPETAPDPQFMAVIQRNMEKLRAIHRGKTEMHDALHGEGKDSALLRKLGSHITLLDKEVIQRLGHITGAPDEVKQQIREIGQRCTDICREVEDDRQDAERRFVSALSVPAPDVIRPYAVVSVDMAEYTAHAIQQETQLGVGHLHSFNKGIQKRLEDAILASGSNPALMPAYYSGDGALFYCHEGAQAAVKFAACFQEDCVRRNADTIAFGGKPFHFRFGIATGEVSMSCLYSVIGSILGFSAAGVTIINAARLQSACPDDGILTDVNTYDALTTDEQAAFSETEAVKPKPHENREIPAYRWKG